MQTLDDPRMEALRKWARRVLDHPASVERNRRKAQRRAIQQDVTLVPLDSSTLTPDANARVTAITKDESRAGLGVVSNQPIEGSLFFGQMTSSGEVFLARLVRERRVQGSISEFGFEVLDRYDSFDDLRNL